MAHDIELVQNASQQVRIPVSRTPVASSLRMEIWRPSKTPTSLEVNTGLSLTPGPFVVLTVDAADVDNYVGTYRLFGVVNDEEVVLQAGDIGVSASEVEITNVTGNPLSIATVQDRIREDFPGTTLNPNLWNVVQVGSGHTVGVTGSELRIDTGTTASTTTVLRSTQSWMGAYRVMFMSAATLLSQRIANQTFELRMTNAAGDSYLAWIFDGTSATTAKMRGMNNGTSAPDISGTVTTTAGLSIFEIEAFIDETYFHSRTSDSTTARASTAVKNRQIPSPTEPMFIEIRVSNGATAPATSTRLSLDAILVQDISELTAEITAGRGGGGASQSIPVTTVSTVTTSGAVTGVSALATAVAPVPFKVISAATTNATIVRGAANARLYGYELTNSGAAIRYVKFHNLATAPTAGTTAVVMIIPVPAGQSVRQFGTVPMASFSAGLSMTIVAGAADNDATAVGAAEVVGTLFTI